MAEPVLYKRIAGEIRQQILDGQLQPGDRLPSIRQLTRQWNCTPGTIQHAFSELSTEGLISSRAGQGTRVAARIERVGPAGAQSLRQAHLVHRAEAFILESLVAGQTLDEIQGAVSLAMDRWRAQQQVDASAPEAQAIRFNGSHDMAITWLGAHIQELRPGARLELNYSGSLGGLIALNEGRCDVAGCHLLDATSGEYNAPFVRSLFPGQQMLLVRLAERSIGLMAAPGNPLELSKITDLAQPGIRFINRQAGSGTRVYLDEILRREGLPPARILGYANEVGTHSQAALAIAEGKADAGLGLESAASAYQLAFTPLVKESYDLVTYARLASGGLIKEFLEWLGSPETCTRLQILPGYDFSHSGQSRILDL